MHKIILSRYITAHLLTSLQQRKTPRPKPERHTVISILFVYRNLNPGLEFHHKVVIVHRNLLNHPSDQGFAVLGDFFRLTLKEGNHVSHALANAVLVGFLQKQFCLHGSCCAGRAVFLYSAEASPNCGLAPTIVPVDSAENFFTYPLAYTIFSGFLNSLGFNYLSIFFIFLYFCLNKQKSNNCSNHIRYNCGP